MLDEKEGGDMVVWGIPVITADNGRRIRQPPTTLSAASAIPGKAG